MGSDQYKRLVLAMLLANLPPNVKFSYYRSRKNEVAINQNDNTKEGRVYTNEYGIQIIGQSGKKCQNILGAMHEGLLSMIHCILAIKYANLWYYIGFHGNLLNVYPKFTDFSVGILKTYKMLYWEN